MSGALVGMDIAQAIASLPAHCDVEFSRRLLIAAEASYVAAWWREADRNQPAKDKLDVKS